MAVATATKLNKKPVKNGIKYMVNALLILILSLSVFRYITEPQDNSRCHGMLQEGKWMTEEYKQWQPSGCMSNTYRSKDLGECLGHTHIIYIGDSIMREQYYAMTSIVNIPKPDRDAIHKDQLVYSKQHDITFEIWWDPYLNTTKTIDLLSGKSSIKPSLLVIGSGVWYMRRTGSDYLRGWKVAVDRVFDGAIKHAVADRIMLSPVEIVERDKLIPERVRTLTTDKITIMNNYLREKESSLPALVTPLVVPFVWNEIVTSSKNQTVDGLHFKEPVTLAQSQLALNYRCNQQLLVKTTFPMDTTCCFDYPKPLWYQTTVFLFFLIFVPIGFCLLYISSNRLTDFISQVFPSDYDTLFALFVFGLSVIYMYLGDRSQLFGKIFKQFDMSTFIILNVMMIFGCLVTLKSNGDENESGGFLNRDQTNEWKGWMQLIILIYHFVGASRISAIYNPVRVLVAAYLFQTGYGHFYYFYKKADFSISRILNVMVRLNLLTCVLAYTMRTDYLFYYFSPLVSFWFSVIWITMRILPSYNKHVSFILTKMGVMACVTGFIIHYPGVLEGVFRLLQFMFNIQWNVVDWRFRLSLDAWIVYIGMLCALVAIKISEYNIIVSRPRLWRSMKVVALIVSVLGMIGFFVFELSQSKSSYSAYHPYMSWIPILSFVVLRNYTVTLRNTHSQFFAFIGKISLETFIGQFHMWLAADTKGLLVVLPNASWVTKTAVGWWTNLAVSSILFVFVCYYTSQATGVLTRWLCKGAKKINQDTNSHLTNKEGMTQAVPLLPTTASDGTIHHAPAKLSVEQEDEESDDDLELGEELMYNRNKPVWYRSLYDAIVNNYWIRSIIYLFMMGLVNRFCT